MRLFVFGVIAAVSAISALIPTGAIAQLLENRFFQGICSVASISKEKGVEGITKAEVLSEERFYSVHGNKDLIVVDWKDRKVSYQRKDAEGTFSSPRSLITYSSQTNEVVWLVFREDKNQAPIFHTSSPDQTVNTWGACALSWSTTSEPSLTLRQSIPGILERLKKDDGTSFTRVTSEGMLTSCELGFNHSFLDNRSQGGMPVVLNGSFSIQFNRGKIPAFMLKVNAVALDPESMNWKTIKPAFSTVIVNGRNFDSNKIADFTCESGGRCVGYGDPDFGLMTPLTSKPSLDAAILVSLVKGGMDHRFLLSDLAKQSKKVDDLVKFNRCALDIVDRVIKDLAK